MAPKRRAIGKSKTDVAVDDAGDEPDDVEIGEESSTAKAGTRRKQNTDRFKLSDDVDSAVVAHFFSSVYSDNAAHVIISALANSTAFADLSTCLSNHMEARQIRADNAAHVVQAAKDGKGKLPQLTTIPLNIAALLALNHYIVNNKDTFGVFMHWWSVDRVKDGQTPLHFLPFQMDVEQSKLYAGSSPTEQLQITHGAMQWQNFSANSTAVGFTVMIADRESTTSDHRCTYIDVGASTSIMVLLCVFERQYICSMADHLLSPRRARHRSVASYTWERKSGNHYHFCFPDNATCRSDLEAHRVSDDEVLEAVICSKLDDELLGDSAMSSTWTAIRGRML